MESVLQWAQEHMMILCMAVSGIFNCLLFLRFKDRLRIGRLAAVVLGIISVVPGVISTFALSGLENWGNPLSSGFSLFGSILIEPWFFIAGAKIFRRNIRDVLDVYTLCAIAGLFAARVNCLVTGCCLGALMPHSDTVRWPTRETEMVFHLILFVILYKKTCKNKLPGSIFPIYMISYGVFRFIEEWFREGRRVLGPMHMAHLWAILSLIVGGALYFEISERGKKHQIRGDKT